MNSDVYSTKLEKPCVQRTRTVSREEEDLKGGLWICLSGWIRAEIFTVQKKKKKVSGVKTSCPGKKGIYTISLPVYKGLSDSSRYLASDFIPRTIRR